MQRSLSGTAVRVLMAWCVLCLSCMVFAQSAMETGGVRGRLQVRAEAPRAPRIVSHELIREYSLATGRYRDAETAAASSAPPSAIVFLVPEGKTSPPAASRNTVVIMDQKNEIFVPHVLPVQRGTVVRFMNSDSIYHNVFSLSPTRSFDLGRYPRGKFRSVKFDRIGTVRVYCDIHTHMNAYVIVTDTPYFVRTDEDGAFAFEGVMPGTYSIHYWDGTMRSTDRRVKIAAGRTTELEGALP